MGKLKGKEKEFIENLVEALDFKTEEMEIVIDADEILTIKSGCFRPIRIDTFWMKYHFEKLKTNKIYTIKDLL